MERTGVVAYADDDNEAPVTFEQLLATAESLIPAAYNAVNESLWLPPEMVQEILTSLSEFNLEAHGIEAYHNSVNSTTFEFTPPLPGDLNRLSFLYDTDSLEINITSAPPGPSVRGRIPCRNEATQFSVRRMPNRDVRHERPLYPRGWIIFKYMPDSDGPHYLWMDTPSMWYAEEVRSYDPATLARLYLPLVHMLHLRTQLARGGWIPRDSIVR